MLHLHREGLIYSQKIVDKNRQALEARLGRELKIYSWPEVCEWTYRMKDIEWDTLGVPSRELTEEEQQYVLNERLLCQIDFRYWLERYCLILTDEKRVEPLRPWPSQEALLSTIAASEEIDPKIRVILLKSRQIGGTAFSQAVVGHMMFLQPHTQGLVAADHPDVTLKLYQTLDRIYGNMPGWLKPGRDWNVKGTHMRFPVLDADIIYGAGNQKTTMGQGLNVDICHLTEVSTWDQNMCQAIDADLMPAFDSSRKHHSMMLLESTGAGAKGNWFHDQYQSAVEGNSLFKPVFIAWYLRPGWRASGEGMAFSPETQAMAARVQRETGLVLDREQLAWYQLKRRELESKDNLELFYQEFPSTVEEAFQTGLRSVFPITLRSKLRDRVRNPVAVYEVNIRDKKLRAVDVASYIKDPTPGKADNKLLMWEEAKPGYIYVIGVDASYGMTGKDAAAIEVLRVGNKWAPDEQVAEFRGTISPLDLATPAFMLGNIYKDKMTGLPAEIVVEINPGSPGIVTQVELQRLGYIHFYVRRTPNRLDGSVSRDYGWYTTRSSRPLFTEMGVDYLKKGDLLVNSAGFIEEMGAFVVGDLKNGQKRMEHAPGYHDDRIISLFMALYVAHEDDNTLVADDRRRAMEQLRTPKAVPRQFQDTGDSWDACMARWEESLA